MFKKETFGKINRNEIKKYAKYVKQIEKVSDDDEKLNKVLKAILKDDNILPDNENLDEYMSNPKNKLIF